MRRGEALYRYTGDIMARQIKAVYEQGVFRPLEPLPLPEHHAVILTIEDKGAPKTRESREPVNERHEEMQWLTDQSAAYAGQWVALDGSRLVAHGNQLAQVREAARVAGVTRPLLTHVPLEGEVPFGGW